MEDLNQKKLFLSTFRSALSEQEKRDLVTQIQVEEMDLTGTENNLF